MSLRLCASAPLCLCASAPLCLSPLQLCVLRFCASAPLRLCASAPLSRALPAPTCPSVAIFDANSSADVVAACAPVSLRCLPLPRRMPAVPLQLPQPGIARADMSAVTAAAVYVAVHAVPVVAACDPELAPFAPDTAACRLCPCSCRHGYRPRRRDRYYRRCRLGSRSRRCCRRRLRPCKVAPFAPAAAAAGKRPPRHVPPLTFRTPNMPLLSSPPAPLSARRRCP